MNGRFNRRDLLVAGAGLALAAGSDTGAAGAPGTRLPNVLYIMGDDMGYADLGCFGRTDYRTPQLDRLARQGLLMTSGYANSAVCSASRTALITGRYQYRLKVGLYEPGGMAADYGIPDGHATMPGQFRKLGYRTSLIGKWHLGDPPKYGPLQRGYDYYFGFLGGGMDYFRVGGSRTGMGAAPGPTGMTVGDGCSMAGVASPGRGAPNAPAGMSSSGGPPGAGGTPPPGRGAQASDAGGDGMTDGLYEDDRRTRVPGYLTDVLADRAIDEIRRTTRSGKPFFMSLHFNAPHWPWEGPGDEEASKQVVGAYHADGGSLRKYGEMVGALDAAIGRVLQALEKSGAARDTIVIFTSDNGGERFSNTWPFAGSKGELLEGGIRVPLIVRWPARIKAGRHSSQTLIHMDWMPTLLAAAGGAPDAAYPADGMNLLPQLLGEQPDVARKLYWRYLAADQAALRDGDWKYLKLGGREFLFNIAADERERANRRPHDPERFERMKADWNAWNATMLPYLSGQNSDNPKLSHCWADHY